jgi:hypothetical protein
MRDENVRVWSGARASGARDTRTCCPFQAFNASAEKGTEVALFHCVTRLARRSGLFSFGIHRARSAFTDPSSGLAARFVHS